MKTWLMRIACWIPKAPNTVTHNIQYSLLFHSNDGCTNAPQCYVTRTVHCLSCIFWLHQDSLDVVMSCKHNTAHSQEYRLFHKVLKHWSVCQHIQEMYTEICTVPLSLSPLYTVPLSTRERRGRTFYYINGSCSDIWRISRSVPTSFPTNR